MALTLPPLNALRAFEAAARTGSYVAAAGELGVSAAAISQHIRKFEDFLGKDVFTRMNNRVVLTDAGRTLFDGTAGALEAISDATSRMLSDRGARGRMVISCIESLAETWALPALTGFCQANEGFRFDLRVEPDPVDLGRGGADLRLGYGLTATLDQVVLPLVQDRVQPMCSPAYAARHPDVLRLGMAAVPDADLIHTSWGPAFGSNPTWRHWHARADLPLPAQGRGFQAGRSSLALDMARAGLGVALAQRLMAATDLAEGRLVLVSSETLPLGQPYCLALPAGHPQKRPLAALATWLQDAARVETAR